jgi:hypothetical protein
MGEIEFKCRLARIVTSKRIEIEVSPAVIQHGV